MFLRRKIKSKRTGVIYINFKVVKNRKIYKCIINLAGTLALGVTTCSNHNSYHYNSKIGEEEVRFYEESLGLVNVLEVTRADGTVIKYFDVDDDLKLDSIYITKDGDTIKYINNVIGQKVLEEGQSQFDEYLAKIHELKQTKGLRDISKK